MQDPIGNFERIRELYLRYLDTAFRIGDDSVSEERRTLLRKPGQLTTAPLVEPIPRYQPKELPAGGEVTLQHLLDASDPEEALAEFDESAREAFVDLVLAGLFPGQTKEFKPYQHQLEMLARGVRSGRPGIVTSGTGSGKTESFLLPVLAAIVREATTWGKPKDDYLKRPWWHDPETQEPWQREKTKGARKGQLVDGLPPCQKPNTKNPLRNPALERSHRDGESENRRAAVRAILLYPMNALVEDQLVRLRRTLDSRESREVMDEQLNGNRIFFGRYTGATPVTGSPGSEKNPRGLDSFLARGKMKAKKAGDVWAPDHPKSDSDGNVDLEKVFEDELNRRKRRIDDLFDFTVASERGQRQARLHAIDQESARALAKSLRGKAQPMSAVDFIDLARAAGKRLPNTLARDFRRATGAVLTPEQRKELEEEKLFLNKADATKAPRADGDDVPFMFPSVDGAEQLHRWDMQAFPPDILITNVSMLSGMLNREVEDPIFAKTREWLEEEDGSYFYLVLDELHLQRGAAGTEVAYLLRSLIHRLGLDREDQRHKLRILASSASLPAEPAEELEKSCTYLWQMFGRLGLDQEKVERTSEKERHLLWREAIRSGRPQAGRYDPKDEAPFDPMPPRPFTDLLRGHFSETAPEGGSPAEPATARNPEESGAIAKSWRAVSRALGCEDPDLKRTIAAAGAEAAARLQWACWEEGDDGPGRPRAVTTSTLAKKLFGRELTEETEEAVRGFLFVRGALDGLEDFLGDAAKPPPPSFRVHTFFRSIEGLYAPAVGPVGGSETGAPVGALTIDQKDRTEDGERRLFELVYCECCGDLLFGGRRASIAANVDIHTELLPQEENLAGLPDQASSQRFEDFSWDEYALFWPGLWEHERQALRPDLVDIECGKNQGGEWKKAVLDPFSGVVFKEEWFKRQPEGRELVRGWYFAKSVNPGHKRHWSDAGTNVPYACPNCATSFRGRRRPMRLSPLRNFRAGFAKTTQLLATELFDGQRAASDGDSNPKLVSFSDSRQDAAKAALDVERNHHQDVRRFLLVESLRSSDRRKAASKSQLAKSKSELEAALSSADDVAKPLIEKAIAELQPKLEDCRDPGISLFDILGNEAEVGDEFPVPVMVERMARLGIHPSDGAGIDQLEGQIPGAGRDEPKTRRFLWDQLLELRPGGAGEEESVGWRRSDEDTSTPRENARRDLLVKLQKAMTDVVFGKTYFALEETGLGYATVDRRDGDETTRRDEELASVMRVLTDVYRYKPSPYEQKQKGKKDAQENDGEPGPTPWRIASEVDRERVKLF